jgi:undecaprenyl diphosphate synthase
MLRRLYEYLLAKQISRHPMPKCVAIILSPEDLDPRGLQLLGDLIGWSTSLGLWSLAIYINDDSLETRQKMISYLSDLPALVSLHDAQGARRLGAGGQISLLVSLGYGGKREVTEAVRKLLVDVEAGILEPEEIDEGALETRLRFQQKPDLVIRAGGRQLSDFMIWQAAYSELYFTEVNWRFLRKVDFLRAIRDFQKRKRRFGR